MIIFQRAFDANQFLGIIAQSTNYNAEVFARKLLIILRHCDSGRYTWNI